MSHRRSHNNTKQFNSQQFDKTFDNKNSFMLKQIMKGETSDMTAHVIQSPHAHPQDQFDDKNNPFILKDLMKNELTEMNQLSQLPPPRPHPPPHSVSVATQASLPLLPHEVHLQQPNHVMAAVT